ncbi:hypothetical protein VCV18_011446 [Metarhizium anisopliae]
MQSIIAGSPETQQATTRLRLPRLRIPSNTTDRQKVSVGPVLDKQGLNAVCTVFPRPPQRSSTLFDLSVNTGSFIKEKFADSVIAGSDGCM